MAWRRHAVLLDEDISANIRRSGWIAQGCTGCPAAAWKQHWAGACRRGDRIHSASLLASFGCQQENMLSNNYSLGLGPPSISRRESIHWLANLISIRVQARLATLISPYRTSFRDYLLTDLEAHSLCSSYWLQTKTLGKQFLTFFVCYHPGQWTTRTRDRVKSRSKWAGRLARGIHGMLRVSRCRDWNREGFSSTCVPAICACDPTCLLLCCVGGGVSSLGT
ncbi:hypothetical protein B0H67DRAFT_570298 [Lasiosphaeris hirsuta]|uniref:Uncharacterized protein n=1 Tax=Lasiosphaeris hirsuta TaxID=260670 RepID=A0AA40E2A6_9PEZI|nr:hypothetical protein B0H67DRAFT_570298 [Lasiosphaeris hirsuta]